MSRDSFYSSVLAARSASNQSVGAAAPRGLNTPRTVVDERTQAAAKAAQAPQTVRQAEPRAASPASVRQAEERSRAALRAGAKATPVVDEQTQARAKAAQAPKSTTSSSTKNDPYYTRGDSGYSPAQIEAIEAQRDAAIAKAEAIDEYYRIQNELAKVKAAQGDGDKGTGDEGAGDTGADDTGADDTGAGDTGAGDSGAGNAGADTTIPGAGIGLGAGGAGPESAATKAVLDQIAALTEQLKQQQAAAAAEAAKPKVVGTRTVRKTGGVVEVVEVMSDGSQGKVIDSYKDFGARDSVMKMFENTGLGKTFIDSLMNTIDKVYEDNIMPTESQVLNSIYSSDAYKQRFAGNEIIRKRMSDGQGRPGDRLLTPAEYIKTEDAYKELMSEAGLPPGFYDQPEDFTKFIGELGTSVAEVAERINLAKSALQSADQFVKDSLQSFYGWTEQDMVAYLLDPDKAFQVVNSRFAFSTSALKERYTAAEVGGAAGRAGMGRISEGFAKEIVQAGKQDLAERAFQGAAREQEDYRRLMGLYGETAGTEDLAREALALAGGAEVGIKTKKLASKERAKFQQQSAIDKTSLGSRLRSPDV